MRIEKTILALVALVLVGLIGSESAAQIFGKRAKTLTGPVCVGPNCQQSSTMLPPMVVDIKTIPIPVSLPLPDDIEEVTTAVADGPHCRCLVSGSCGSGTICGADATGAYVVSNAHVWGTQIGKVVNVDLVSSGQTKRMQGRIVFSGYSNSRMVDFAIARVPGLTSKVYMPMVKTEPADGPYGTRGSPRCVWPQVTKPFNDPRNYGRGLITGTPDAIGGQSGSAIYNSKGQQIALLTWSINGRCAGQKTSLLWQVATERNVMLADERPNGLSELNDSPNRPETVEGIHGCECVPAVLVESTRPDTEEGIHGQLALVERADDDGFQIVGQRIRPITENVIASQASMQDLPIWYDPNQQPVDPPTDPVDPPVDGDCYKLTENEWKLIQFLREQNKKEAGLGDRFKDRDWVQLILKWLPVILELIRDIQENRKG